MTLNKPSWGNKFSRYMTSSSWICNFNFSITVFFCHQLIMHPCWGGEQCVAQGLISPQGRTQESCEPLCLPPGSPGGWVQGIRTPYSRAVGMGHLSWGHARLSSGRHQAEIARLGGLAPGAPSLGHFSLPQAFEPCSLPGYPAPVGLGPGKGLLAGTQSKTVQGWTGLQQPSQHASTGKGCSHEYVGVCLLMGVMSSCCHFVGLVGKAVSQTVCDIIDPHG